MYKDVLEKLNRDRKVDKGFMERLEKNGFEINYGKFEYWDGQEYIQIGTQKVWLVEIYYRNNSCGVCFRYRNDLVTEIKEVLETEKNKLEREIELVDKILPIK